jgi:hypothetical protein
MAPTEPGRLMAASVREWRVRTLRPAARVYVVGVVVLDWAVTLTALAMTGRVSLAHLGLYIALLGCGGVVIEVIRAVGEPDGTIPHDLLGVWFLPIAVMFPPGFAFLAPILVGAYRVVRVRSLFQYRRVFNAAALSLGWGAASIVFHAAPASIAGPAPWSGQHAVTWVVLAAGCYLMAWGISSALMMAAVRLATPEVRLRGGFGGRTAWVSDLGGLCLGVVVAAEVAVAGLVVAILAVGPVIFIQRYLGNAQLAEQAGDDAQSGRSRS